MFCCAAVCFAESNILAEFYQPQAKAVRTYVLTGQQHCYQQSAPFLLVNGWYGIFIF